MPVCVATAPCSMLPAAAIDAADQMDYQAGWMAALVDEELSMDADAMSFDIISTVLSRCATPPPESLAPSAANSPYESRCQSPFDLLLDCSASSGHASLASTPYSSAPGSPSSCDYAAANAAPCSVATNLFFAHPISSSSHPNLSFTLTMDTIDEAYDSFSSPCSPAAAAATVAPTPLNALKQARRLSKAGVEAKPMKIKRVSSAAAVLASPTTSSVSATSSTSQISSSSSSSLSPSSSSSSAAAAAATKVSSKRMKAAALANKRDSHNISERNRRHELKVSFTALQNLVPNLLSASRAHTGTVLKETIAYINALQQQEQQLVAAKAALVAEQSLLLAAVSC